MEFAHKEWLCLFQITMAEKMAHLIPKARLEIFEHSRHFPFIEEPDKFLSVMREFLNAAE